MNITPSFIRRLISDRPNLLRIIDNMGWLTIDRVLRTAVGLFVGIWVAQHLGPEMFGALSLALAITAILEAIGTLGLQSVVVRDLVKKAKLAPKLLATSAGLQATASLIVYFFTIVVLFAVGPLDRTIQLLIALVSSRILFQWTSIASYWFEANINSRFSVVARGIAFACATALKVTLVLLEAPVYWFGLAVLVEAVIAATMLLLAFRKSGIGVKLVHFDFRIARYLLWQSWPLIVSSIAIGLAMRIDQVMIGYILNITEVGYYAVAASLAEVLILPGVILATSVFPRLIQLQATRFEYEYVRIIRYPFIALLLGATVIALSSELLINLVLGSDYLSSSPVLAILAFSIPLTYINLISSKYLLMKGDQIEILRRQIFGAFVNVGLNFVLIPQVGIIGAALATVLADLLISIADIGRKKYRHLLALKIEAVTGVKVRAT